jgi:hypothetical protein
MVLDLLFYQLVLIALVWLQTVPRHPLRQWIIQPIEDGTCLTTHLPEAGATHSSSRFRHPGDTRR